MQVENNRAALVLSASHPLTSPTSPQYVTDSIAAGRSGVYRVAIVNLSPDAVNVTMALVSTWLWDELCVEYDADEVAVVVLCCSCT